MESLDDILKQMNTGKVAQDISEETESTVLNPRVVLQKEDVVYIKNPCKDWAYNGLLNFGRD